MLCTKHSTGALGQDEWAKKTEGPGPTRVSGHNGQCIAFIKDCVPCTILDTDKTDKHLTSTEQTLRGRVGQVISKIESM